MQTLSAKADTVLAEVDKLIERQQRRGQRRGAQHRRVLQGAERQLLRRQFGAGGRRRARQEDRPAGRPAAGLSDDVDKLVKAVDPAKVSGIVGDVKSLTGRSPTTRRRSIRRSPDAAALAKRLNDTAGKLDSALADFDNLVKAVDTKKIATFVDGADALGQTLQRASGRHRRDGEERDRADRQAQRFRRQDRRLMTSLQGFVGSPDLKGPLGELGDAARSVRQLADNLDVRTKDIAAGISHFSLDRLARIRGAGDRRPPHDQRPRPRDPQFRAQPQRGALRRQAEPARISRREVMSAAATRTPSSRSRRRAAARRRWRSRLPLAACGGAPLDTYELNAAKPAPARPLGARVRIGEPSPRSTSTATASWCAPAHSKWRRWRGRNGPIACR